jgi:hypothetical protein
MKTRLGQYMIHNQPLYKQVGSAGGIWIDPGITRARFLRDAPNAKVNEVGTITRVFGLGRVEVTLEDGRVQRIDKCFLHVLGPDSL